MEENNTKNIFSVERTASEAIEELQQQHEQKTSRIEELKGQIESAKSRLETVNKDIPEEKLVAFKALSEKYNTIRDEHNALLLAKEFGKSDK